MGACALDVALLPQRRSDTARIEADTDFLPRGGGNVEVPAISRVLAEAGDIAGLHAFGCALLPGGNEARHAVLQQERPNLLHAGGSLSSLMPAARCKPLLKAQCGCLHRLPSRPGDDPIQRCDFAAGSDEAEPLGHAPNLPVSSSRHVGVAEAPHDVLDGLPDLIDLRDDRGEILSGCDTIVLLGCRLQMNCKRIRRSEAVQLLEHTHARTSIGGYVHDPDLLTGR